MNIFPTPFHQTDLPEFSNVAHYSINVQLNHYKANMSYITRNVGSGIYLTCKYFIDMRPNCFSDSFELIGNQCARVTSSFYYAN